jgi:hypothetical protein
MNPTDLEKQYRGWSSEDLVRALTEKRADYTPEARAAMEQELRNRNVPPPDMNAYICTCTDCGKEVSLEDKICPHCGGDLTDSEMETPGPLFLHIPVWRLVVLSLISCGAYEAYWIYKNWRYVKERYGLKLAPFWRGVFGIFFCHGIMKRIREDPEARAVLLPSFSAGGLATGFVILILLANLIARAPNEIALAAPFIPSFLFLLPVQNYVNRVSRQRRPEEKYYRWSAGHFVCLAYGLAIWTLTILLLGVE